MYWFHTDSRVYRHSAMIHADKANQALKRRKIEKSKLCQGINQEFTVKSFHSDYVVKDVPKSKKGVRCLLPDRISQSCFFNQ